MVGLFQWIEDQIEKKVEQEGLHVPDYMYLSMYILPILMRVERGREGERHPVGSVSLESPG